MKKELFIVFLLLIIPAVSAELFITPPSGLYNIGDELNISVSLSKSVQTSDFVSVLLICNGQELEIYKNPVGVKAGEQRSVDFKSSIDSFVIGSLKGDCFLRAKYSGEQVETRRFEISNEIVVTTTFSSSIVDPEGTLQITGNAVKKNGQAINGEVVLNIPDLGISSQTHTNNGAFSFNASIPEKSRAKIYNMSIKAYDTDFSSQIANEGATSSSIRVRQVLHKLDVAVSNLELFPGKNLSYNVLAYDQADDEMNTEAQLKIFGPDGEVVIDKLTQSGIYQIFYSQTNTSAGSWSISVKSGELSSARSFMVSEYESADFILENNILVVRNKGNVPYTKPVQISIGGSEQVREIALGVGGEKRFRLDAPDGEYNIAVSDGNSSSDLGNVFLTGKVISIKDNDQKFISSLPWTWIVIILVLGLVAFFYYLRTTKQDYVGRTPALTMAPRMSVLKPHSLNAKESSQVSQGKKQKATVVAVKIKNHSDANRDQVQETVNRILAEVKSAKAQGEYSSGNVLCILSPSLTKLEDNSLGGVSLAQNIKNIIDNHNKKYNQKINYGIGVHEGEIIGELVRGALRYHALGNTVIGAKKLADSSQREVSISDSIHSLTRAKVKVEKGREGWNVKSISDNSKYSEFIDGFMHRNG